MFVVKGAVSYSVVFAVRNARAAPSVLKSFVSGIINAASRDSSSAPIATSMLVLLSLFSFVTVAVRTASGVKDSSRLLNTFAPSMSPRLAA